MKKLILLFSLLLASCTIKNDTTKETEAEQWTCKHLYSPKERSYTFIPENFEVIRVMECPNIIRNGGECPSYVHIIDNRGNEIWLTADEWENYNCTIEESK